MKIKEGHKTNHNCELFDFIFYAQYTRLAKKNEALKTI